VFLDAVEIAKTSPSTIARREAAREHRTATFISRCAIGQCRRAEHDVEAGPVMVENGAPRAVSVLRGRRIIDIVADPSGGRAVAGAQGASCGWR
jgi:hypothetical protein